MKDNALYDRYMDDDVLRGIKHALIQKKLNKINSYHRALRFTIGEEKEGKLTVQDTNFNMVQQINRYGTAYELS